MKKLPLLLGLLGCAMLSGAATPPELTGVKLQRTWDIPGEATLADGVITLRGRPEINEIRYLGCLYPLAGEGTGKTLELTAAGTAANFYVRGYNAKRECILSWRGSLAIQPRRYRLTPGKDGDGMNWESASVKKTADQTLAQLEFIVGAKNRQGELIEVKIEQIRYQTVTDAPVPPVAVVPGERNKTAFRIDTHTTLTELQNRLAPALNVPSNRKWADYLVILDELANQERYLVLPGKEVFQAVDPKRVVVYFRHDIDNNPFLAQKMAQEEKSRGLRGTYYILATAAYYGELTPSGVTRYACLDPLYREIQAAGHEIGIHHDYLQLMLYCDADPLEFQKQETAYYRKNGIDIVGTAGHGSGYVLSRKLNNVWMFSEFGKSGFHIENGKRYEYGKLTLRDFGFAYEGYKFNRDFGIWDAGNDEILQELRSAKPGTRLSLLIHPGRWNR